MSNFISGVVHYYGYRFIFFIFMPLTCLHLKKPTAWKFMWEHDIILFSQNCAFYFTRER